MGDTRATGPGYPKRRIRRREDRPRRGPNGFEAYEPWENNVLSPMGRIEQLGRFAGDVNKARGWRRWAGKAILIGPLVIGAAFFLLTVAMSIVTHL